jgi:hypothetical protein
MYTVEKRREIQREWYRKHAEQVCLRKKEYYLRTKGSKPKARIDKKVASKRTRDYRINHPEKVDEYERKHKLKSIYGITLEDYKNILNKQNGKCAICGEPSINKRFSVDHNHTTGKVRGLLCNNCNTGIGLLKENLEIIQRALLYLKNNQ